jgi:hypothetical protein
LLAEIFTALKQRKADRPEKYAPDKYRNDNRNPESRFGSFVMKDYTSKNYPGKTAQNRNNSEGPFADPRSTKLGTSFVYSHHDQGCKTQKNHPEQQQKRGRRQIEDQPDCLHRSIMAEIIC